MNVMFLRKKGPVCPFGGLSWKSVVPHKSYSFWTNHILFNQNSLPG